MKAIHIVREWVDHEAPTGYSVEYIPLGLLKYLAVRVADWIAPSEHRVMDFIPYFIWSHIWDAWQWCWGLQGTKIPVTKEWAESNFHWDIHRNEDPDD